MATLDTAVKRKTADVVRMGDKIVLPDGMSAAEAKEILEARIKFEEEKVILVEDFDVFPIDGAVVFERVIKEKYGWVPAIAVREMTFFGEKVTPPTLLVVEVGPGKTQSIPWGRFTLPGLEGYVETKVGRKKERLVFQVQATIKRKYEDRIKAFFDLVRDGIQKHSIYRGQAIRIRFTDDEEQAVDMPQPTFVDTAHIDENMLVFSEHIADAVNTNLFTPIRRAQDCISNGIPLKRGVLLGGKYGCGKTLAAAVAARIAVDHGITYVYAEKAKDLGQAIEFARQYQSPAAVVFVEDIDRSITGARTEEMDEILNIVDGIDSKKANIIVVLTTNEMEKINAAMLRPGRLDAVIHIEPPDGKAVEKLLRNYGRETIRKGADLSAVGEELKGRIPAVIAEVVKRASLAQLAIQAPGTMVKEITPQALLQAARTMTHQLKLLDGEQPVKDHTPIEQRILDLFRESVDENPSLTKMGNRIRTMSQNFDLE